MASGAHVIDNNKRHLDRFYALLMALRDGLGGTRRLCDCTGKMPWPERGVYFFFEPGEFRREHPDQLRVVRVGTHAVSQGSKTKLWDRLRTHRGDSNGWGNHRGSIFRWHVGKAILARSQGAVSMPTWGIGMSAPKEIRQREAGIEKIVSEYLGRMEILWLAVNDEAGKQSKRAYLERNALGLLTAQMPPVDPPSPAWLGNHSPEPLIRQSGLWNLDHVATPYDPAFLDVMAGYVATTLAERRS